MNIETWLIKNLTLDPNNARKHDQKNLDAIKASLEKFGQRKPIVVTAEGTVLAGNGTITAAKALGWTDITVAVAPADWDADTAKAYALADNRSAELAEWDQGVLASQLVELDVAGWDIGELGFGVPDTRIDASDESEPLAFDEEEPVISKVGDIWQIGPHRIACGDSTDEATLARLTAGLEIKAIITDPPYGIAIVKNNLVGGNSDKKRQDVWGGRFDGWENTKYRPVIGDESPDIAAVSFNMAQNLFPKTIQCWWGGNHYTGKAHLPDSSAWLVWDKKTGTNDFADAELAWTNHTGAVRIFAHLWNGMARASEHGKGVRFHPTQKPTALTQWVIDIIKIPKGAVILDLFAGSGSTLVGAADSGCVGVGIELDPFYVDKIVQRLEKQTGLTAELLT